MKNKQIANTVLTEGLHSAWMMEHKKTARLPSQGVMVNYARNLRSFLHQRIPAQLVIQATNHCNAQCPQCGMRVTAAISRHTLSTELVKRIIDAAAVKGVQAISFTGGEPLLFVDELVELIGHAGRAGIPYIRTGTNGFVFRHSGEAGFVERIKRLADRLAETPLRNFWISLDSSLPQVHESMRGLAGVVAGIEKAIPIFHAAGLYPSANLGINRRVGGDATQRLQPRKLAGQKVYIEAFYQAFTRAFDAFYGLAANLGFSIVNTCYPMSIDQTEQTQGLRAVYPASAIDTIVRFSKAEKGALYQALMDAIPRHRSRLRIFSPLSSLYMLARQYSSHNQVPASCGCRGGVDFFFIDACDGHTYPCGYRGNENLGQFQGLDLAALKPSCANCLRCDWECFRDPTELFAPVLTALDSPLALARRFYQDPRYAKLWWQDMRYYQACDFFNGRKPMNSSRLRCF